MPRMLTAALFFATALVLTPGVSAQEGTDGFPHAQHARLFTSCADCHPGVGDGGDVAYPSPERCTTCHDGDREPTVNWTGPTPGPSNLVFTHEEHRARSGDENPECVACHGEPGGGPMAVGRPDPDRCLTCHEESGQHLTLTRECRSCHIPLVETTFAVERIRSLPKPPGHQTADFLSRHAPDRVRETCAVCHARQSCVRCHVNAGSLPEIAALEPDGRIAELTDGRAPENPLPASHEARVWDWRHGVTATASTTSCANCHARESCQSCHAGAETAIESLPDADQGAPGVTIESPLVHGPDFASSHAGAAARSEVCSSCHTSDSCAECHDAAATPAFHGPDFLERHAADVYAATGDCLSCHSAEAFCRSCHASAGLESSGRTGQGFHTAQAFWLVGHGQAARQSMESCASCHAQSDCIRCHSASSGWGINPHRPGYEGERTEARNPILCRRCHFDAGGTP